MSSQHSGNMLNSITFEEHDGTLNAKKTSLISAATIYAVVNTSAPGISNSIVTVANTPLPVTFGGNVTLDAGSKTQIIGNVTLSDPKGFIGLVTVVGSLSPAAGNVTLDPGSFTGIKGNVTLSDSKGYIGLVSVAQPLSTTFSGNVTLDPGSKTAIIGNMTISDSKGFIGLVTNQPAASWPDPKAFIGLVTVTGGVSFSGNVTLDVGSKTQIVGNVTISDSKQFIGLVSVSGFANPLPVSFSGNVTLDVGSKTGITGNVTLSDSKTFIGLTTTTLGASPAFIGLVTVGNTISTTFSGNVTLDAGSKTQITGNVTISDSKGFIGLMTIGGGTAWSDPKGFIGLVTVTQASSARTITGNVTLSDSKGFIGLVTATGYVGIKDYVGGDLGTVIGGSNLSDNIFGSAEGALYSAAFNFVGNSGAANTWSPMRSAQSASGATGVGLLASGIMGNDGTRYRPILTGTDGRIQSITTVAGGSIGILGNITLSDAKTNIGLVTLTGGTAWTDPKTYIGLATVNNATAWPDPKTFIGLVTIGHTPNVAVVGNITISDGKGFIGLVTVGNTVTVGAHGITGNVTLSDAKTYVGLTTTTLGIGTQFIGLVTTSPTWSSNITVFTQIVSASGNTTIFIAPASNRFWLTSLHVASLGRSELEIRSGATTLIPFTALATTGGYIHNFEQPLPSRAQADGFVANLNGAATISIMAATYFAA